MASPQIIIIGGGIGGLAMALALQRRGIAANVYERAEALREVGAGISLWCNATQVLEQLGLLEEAIQLSHQFTHVHLNEINGRMISAVHVGQYTPASLGIHRAELLRLLQRDLPAEKIFLDHTFDCFEQVGDKVIAHFTNGATAAGDLLIGADGLRSRVREQIIGDGEPLYCGYPVWRGLAEFQVANYPVGQVSETWDAGYRFGVFPIGKGLVYWYATANLPESHPVPSGGSKAQMLSYFRTWHAPIPELIAATDEAAIIQNDCYDRRPTRGWSRGRAVLLGDAAHPTSPNMGQGGCMAIEDALVLANLLTDDQLALAAALQQFEALRYARTARITRLSRFYGAIGQWENKSAIALRDLTFRLMPDWAVALSFKSVYEYRA